MVFTKNVTESLNLILKGFLKPGDHVITTSMEHNAVMRPLRQLAGQGVTFSRAWCRPDGSLDPAALSDCLMPNTKALVMTHASNVCGTVLPLLEAGKFCQAHGLRFFVDTANRTVKMTEADCSFTEDCTYLPAIENEGDSIICVPNKLRIVAGSEVSSPVTG